ncbi:hypothetical protein BU17DRAFT_99611 [Hysterangium stoloniferum]|nr:hypothetical protein BU17DRAFT_99611 [Hysterangium stoloniferum]
MPRWGMPTAGPSTGTVHRATWSMAQLLAREAEEALDRECQAALAVEEAERQRKRDEEEAVRVAADRAAIVVGKRKVTEVKSESEGEPESPCEESIDSDRLIYEE